MLVRASLFSSSLALALAAASAAAAQEPAVGEQAEWSQNYDAGPRIRVAADVHADPFAADGRRDRRGDRALSRHRGARRLERRSAARRTPALGSHSQSVVALRQRLIQTGDLDPAAGRRPVYDSYVEAGVKRFQARHGLNTTGA